jgi:hypothetical protein
MPSRVFRIDPKVEVANVLCAIEGIGLCSRELVDIAKWPAE